MASPLFMVLVALQVLVLLAVVVLMRRSGSDHFFRSIEVTLEGLQRSQEQLATSFNRQLDDIKDVIQKQNSQNRQEIQKNILGFNESILSRMTEIASLQKQQLDTFSKQLTTLTASNEKCLTQVREALEKRLGLLQEDNNKKLEQMRATVDEKLQSTLEKRLGESFKVVSDRLEVVHKGLGEMQVLAAGVGDLKRVLTNVKTRGIWGEIQLANLLEQVLSPDQYAENVATRPNSNDRVEFAIRLPGQKGDKKNVVWLPIDAKFPQDCFQRLLEAQESADVVLVEEATKILVNQIKHEAKTISEKYIEPPHTTDFGILFLPVEGLYSEVIRQPGLIEFLQDRYRIVISGPTTLAALLNSLQMGFRTLAIEKRSSEVWTLLGKVKSEFGKFGDILEKTHKKIQEAGNNLDLAARKTRTIERNLGKVESLPVGQADTLNLGELEVPEPQLFSGA